MSPIRAVRERAGLTQIDVCFKARVSPATLRHAEKWGASAVTEETLRKIARALGVELEELQAVEVQP